LIFPKIAWRLHRTRQSD